MVTCPWENGWLDAEAPKTWSKAAVTDSRGGSRMEVRRPERRRTGMAHECDNQSERVVWLMGKGADRSKRVGLVGRSVE